MKTFTVTAIGLALSAAIGTAAANPLDHRHDGYNNGHTTHTRAHGSNYHRHDNDNAELLVSALLGYAIGASTNGTHHYSYGQSSYYGQPRYYNGQAYQGSGYGYQHNAYTGWGRSDYYGNSGYYGRDDRGARRGRDHRDTRGQRYPDGNYDRQRNRDDNDADDYQY